MNYSNQRSGRAGGQHGNDRPNSDSAFNASLDPKWITEGLTESAIDFSEKFAKELVTKGLTTSQIRNFFGEVRRLQMKLQQDPNNSNTTTGILLLRPKLAYAAKRKSEKGTNGSEMLRDYLDKALKAAGTDVANFNRFADFFESILAFHKVHGGK